MSGYGQSDHRAAGPSNSFGFVPYTGNCKNLAKIPKQPPTPYSPVYTRSRPRTNFDVRNTYLADHMLRTAYKVTKSTAPKRIDHLWRRNADSRDSSSEGAHGVSDMPSSTSTTPLRSSPSPENMNIGFLPVTALDAKKAAKLALKARRRINFDDILAIEVDQVSHLWSELKTEFPRYVANRVKKPFRKAGRWASHKGNDVTGAAVQGLDLAAAVPSIITTHRKMMCNCDSEEMFWKMHGLEGQGLFTFLLTGGSSESDDEEDRVFWW